MERFAGGGATGGWTNDNRPSDTKFGGAGASGDWSESVSRTPSSTSSSQAASKHPENPSQGRPQEQFRRVERNGYKYQIDSLGRTREVSGTLARSDKQLRSRKAQREAGGSDRRHDDDGGHYIAARFNGPTDAFNHFAQNSNFNRGVYRNLENEWAKSQREGKRVEVKIVPHYRNGSQRPSSIDVTFFTNSRRDRINFFNEYKGIYNGN